MPNKDEGKAALMTLEFMTNAFNSLKAREIFHLGVEVTTESPVWGDRFFKVNVKSISCAGDVAFHDDSVEASVGIGTHVDGLGHVHHNGLMYGGCTTDEVYDRNGLKRLGLAENVNSFIAPFKLIDMARFLGHDIIPGGTEYSQQDIERAMAERGITIDEGDIVLIHSGWINHYFSDAATFNASEPGLGLEAATYLANFSPVMIAADTIGLEVEKAGVESTYPVHDCLVRRNGIYIGEMFDLREMASKGVTKGVIVAPIIKIAGLAQSRVNPVAFV